MIHNLLAVSVILGCNLSVLGPGDSALNNCIPPIPKSGKIAIANTIIPIPPNQCVILLQNNIPSGSTSTSLITVAPVAVYPEVVSKNIFEKPSIVPVSM